MSTRKAGKQPAESAEQTRHSIINAALRVFALQGFEGVSLRDIAVEAGTTHGLIRHYFGTKEGLWQAAVDDAVARYAAALVPYSSENLAAISDPVAVAADVVRHWLRVSAHYPDIIRLVLHEGINGGPRLTYALAQFAPLGERMEPLLALLHQRGYARHFDNQTFFLFLVTAGAAPFALTAFTTMLTGDDIRSEAQLQRHTERTIATLFGTTSAVLPPALPDRPSAASAESDAT